MKIPQIAIDKFSEHTALNNLAKRMFLLPFTFKKVKKLVIEAEQIREQAWEEIYKAQPELRGKSLSYHNLSKEITIMDDEVECECGCCGDKTEPAPATPAQSPKKAPAKKATKKVKE